LGLGFGQATAIGFGSQLAQGVVLPVFLFLRSISERGYISGSWFWAQGLWRAGWGLTDWKGFFCVLSSVERFDL
jgi:hypothetical protein